MNLNLHNMLGGCWVAILVVSIFFSCINNDGGSFLSSQLLYPIKSFPIRTERFLPTFIRGNAVAKNFLDQENCC